MCQISVLLESGDEMERVMDNVTSLDVAVDGVILSSFFDEPKTIAGVSIARIDFLGGKVFLVRKQVDA